MAEMTIPAAGHAANAKPGLDGANPLTIIVFCGFLVAGWKRIVISVGEKIGKTHLTYAQGASAELVAAATIAAGDMYGLPCRPRLSGLRRCRHDGRQQVRAADGDCSQSHHGVGTDTAVCAPSLGQPVLDLQQALLIWFSGTKPVSPLAAAPNDPGTPR